MKKIALFTLICFHFSLALTPAVSSRIKDISRLVNNRPNQLIGYGLVVGLAGTGDGTTNQATLQGITNMLSNFGVQVDANDLDANNAAAVMCTAKLNAYNVPGDQIDVQVSSIGKAKSLRGGVLLLTPLKAANGQVYAVAQGAISVGGFSIDTKGSKKQKNHTTSGQVPNGAIVEKAVLASFGDDNKLTWILDKQDFTTIENIRLAINEAYPELIVQSQSASKFSISIPSQYEGRLVELISMIDNLEVKTDQIAKIIINEKTGTVVMGGPVKVAPVVIAHENLSISVQNNDFVSQPAALAGGETTLLEKATISVQGQSGGRPIEVVKTQDNTIEQVVELLNSIGVTPADIITILQLMKESGAIKGKLEII